MEKDRKLLTILTPTFNRAYLLDRLYQSLKTQTSKDFIWIILDDGSVDDTKKIVSEFKSEMMIEIMYLFKENGGKHKAINYALSYIDTELTIIVDSDDYLTEDAVETILHYHHKYQQNDKLCGYSFLIQYPDGKLHNKFFPRDEMIGSYIECRINLKIGGDREEVFYTNCLKEYPFPEFPDENFLNEDVVWIPMSLKYSMVHINKVIYVAEYLEDGLSRSGKVLKARNPLGGMERGKMMMMSKCRLSIRIKGGLFCIVFGKFAHKKMKDILQCSGYKYILGALYPFGIVIYHIYRIKFLLDKT